MKEFFVLKIIDVFKIFYEMLGIDYKIMRLIVQAKLTMDGRRVGNSFTSFEEGQKEKNAFYSSLIVYGIIGVFGIPIMLLDISPVIKMSYYFGFFMVMILTSFVSDFSTVILDIHDKDIIGTKGVDLKTLNAAKITHIFIYISLLSLSISALTLITSLRYGVVFFALLFISIILIDIFMIIVTALMYFIIIKLFSGEKLKDILNMFQIGFLLVFTLGFQVVGQSFNFIDFQIIYEPKWWNLLLPPMWFASNFSILEGGTTNNIIIGLRVLSIIVPIISIFLYIKNVPRFESSLQKLSDNTYKSKNNKESFTYRISKLVCKDREERIFFNFVSDNLSKDREFKTRVYPSLAMAAFMPFLMIIMSYDKQGIPQYIDSLKDSPIFLSAYFGVAISQNVLNMIQYSSEYEGSWIYEVLPIKDKSKIYSGMFKASVYKLVISVFGIIAIGFIFIFKLGVIKHLVIILLVNILIAMFTVGVNEKFLPFSKPHKTGGTTSDVSVVFKSMFFVGALALGHYLVRKNTIFTLGYALLLCVVIALSWKKTFKAE